MAPHWAMKQRLVDSWASCHIRDAHAPGMPGRFPRHRRLATPACIMARAVTHVIASNFISIRTRITQFNCHSLEIPIFLLSTRSSYRLWCHSSLARWITSTSPGITSAVFWSQPLLHHICQFTTRRLHLCVYPPWRKTNIPVNTAQNIRITTVPWELTTGMVCRTLNEGAFDNESDLGWVMGFHGTGDKLLPEPMMTHSLTYICITQSRRIHRGLTEYFLS